MDNACANNEWNRLSWKNCGIELNQWKKDKWTNMWTNNSTVFLYNAWWRHQMETFSHYWPFVRGIHRSPVNSPHNGQWRWALMFCLIYVWINSWVNNREAGDLRRYRCPLWHHHNGNGRGLQSFLHNRKFKKISINITKLIWDTEQQHKVWYCGEEIYKQGS